MTGASHDVAIVGAGPAGSSLAILLADRGMRVLLLEREQMPRDKLCGEFLSTEVEAIAATLGVRGRLHDAGANPISQAVCTTPDAELCVPLPGTALGVSRRTLDQILFERAREAGVACMDGVAVTSIAGSMSGVFDIETNLDTHSARFVVGAYGRRTSLDRKLERESLLSRSPFVAFNARFEGPFERRAIELHCFHQGYCGLLVEEGGSVNVCWIVHEDRLKEAGGNPGTLLSMMGTWNPRLKDRLADLEPKTQFLAVSQLSFRQKELFSNGVCMVGDAAGMIAPLCGDGMGMAMRSAQIAAPMIDDFLSGRVREDGLRRAYAHAWTAAFRRRMMLGRVLQALCMRPLLLTPALAIGRALPSLAQFVVVATRS